MPRSRSRRKPKVATPAAQKRPPSVAMITIIRIDPDLRRVAAMRLRCGKNAVPEVKRICRAKKVGHYELTRIETSDAAGNSVEVPLLVAAGLEVTEDQPGFRLRGGQDTAGVGMLFGRGDNGGMVDVPVDTDWVKREIVWLDREEMQEGGE
jgi:hypothetical protein